MLPYNPAAVLLVFALNTESQRLFDPYKPLFAGMGKVNAAYHLTKRLAAWREENGAPPDMVLNLGTAGSSVFKTGTIVNCTRFVQRDFDATALGAPHFVTPFDDAPAILENGHRFADYPEGTCGTGDNFMTDGKMSAWNVVDMESYAFAKVCWFEKIPFGCLKYIADGADGFAATTWEAALETAAQHLHRALEKIFSAIPV